MDVLSAKQSNLAQHPVYQQLSSIENIRHFMSFHVFAVWDFMSLLKSLQKKITCVEVPWKPSPYPTQMVRLINQIVLGEESDIDKEGTPVSHFELYLKAMEEVGANTKPIREFLQTNDISFVPAGAREFVQYNLNTALNGDVVEIASSFFYGREKLIPDMFQTIVDTLKKENIQAPTFIYYLERHIEVDSGEHGPVAMKALNFLTGSNPELLSLALEAGLGALNQRALLWDRVLETLPWTPQALQSCPKLRENPQSLV